MCSSVLLFSFPAAFILGGCGSGRDEERSGGGVLRLIQIRLATPSLAKITPASQENLPQARHADSCSRNAVSFSSARTNAFHCRPVRVQFRRFARMNSLSTAPTPTGLAEIVGDDFPVFHGCTILSMKQRGTSSPILANGPSKANPCTAPARSRQYLWICR